MNLDRKLFGRVTIDSSLYPSATPPSLTSPSDSLSNIDSPGPALMVRFRFSSKSLTTESRNSVCSTRNSNSSANSTRCCMSHRSMNPPIGRVSQCRESWKYQPCRSSKLTSCSLQIPTNAWDSHSYRSSESGKPIAALRQTASSISPSG